MVREQVIGMEVVRFDGEIITLDVTHNGEFTDSMIAEWQAVGTRIIQPLDRIPLLVTIDGASYSSPDTRRRVLTAETFASKRAMVVATVTQLSIARSYMVSEPGLIETEIFTDADQARAWLV